MPHSLPLLDDLRRHLNTERLGRPARGYREVASTNSEAAAWAREGALEGSLVVAEHQTAGRGRLGRRWQAPPRCNLLFSLVLRPHLPPERLPLITVAAGVAVAEAIASCVPRDPKIKWPNDVLIGNRKCCGMLLESSLQGADAEPVVLGPVVLGIGLNVNQDAFPDGLTPRATSLLLEAGRPLPRAPLLADLLRRLETRYDTLAHGGGAAVRAAYEEYLVGRGERLAVRSAAEDASVSGVSHGINERGALLLETSDGVRTFHAGEVTVNTDDGPQTADGGFY